MGLAGLYGTTGRLDPGLARAEEALKVNPKSQSALMHVGLLRERKVDIRKAMEAQARQREFLACEARKAARKRSSH